MRRLVVLVAGLGLLAPLAGCAAPDGQDAALPEATGTCIFTRTIRSWRAIDSRRIILFTRAPMEVEFYSPCFAARSSEDLAFSSRDEQLCDYRSDAILFRNERCAIAAIRPYRGDEFQRQLEREIDDELESGSEDPR